MNASCAAGSAWERRGAAGGEKPSASRNSSRMAGEQGRLSLIGVAAIDEPGRAQLVGAPDPFANPAHAVAGECGLGVPLPLRDQPDDVPMAALTGSRLARPRRAVRVSRSDSGAWQHLLRCGPQYPPTVRLVGQAPGHRKWATCAALSPSFCLVPIHRPACRGSESLSWLALRCLQPGHHR